MHDLYAAVTAALQQGEPVAMATIVRVEGSAPRSVGAQMLICSSGKTLGTIGGGALEAQIVQDARAALASGSSSLKDYGLLGEEGGALGVCGGQVQVFIHVLRPPETVLIVGAGHVAQSLAQAVALAGFRALVVDDRAELLTPERFPTAETRLVDFSSLRTQVRVGGHTHVVIVTRSHEHDEEVLHQMLGAPVAYLGVIGSRTKVRRIFHSLRQAGYSTQQLEQVHAPIGLDIGAETPEEIAISIVAELILCRRGGTGRPLRDVALCL